MKYTLTIESDNKEELLAILNGNKEIAVAVEQTPTAPVTSKSKKKAVSVEVEEKFPEAPAIPATIFPNAGPQTQQPTAPVFDRDLLITHITTTLQDLGTKNLGNKVATMMNGVFNSLGIPPQKIYNLTDEQLQRLQPLFQSEVNNLVAGLSAAAPQSFI